jgi:hypothetical protein
VDDTSTPDEEKLSELILYVADKLSSDPTGGATKINKILFFAEFAAVRSRGFPITGVEYRKLENGPAPRRLLPIRKRLIEEGSVVPATDDYFGRTIHRLVPRRNFDKTLFDDDELRIVDQVIEAMWGMTARQVSDLSHDEKGWQMVEEGETIPYSSAFLSTRFQPTETMRSHAAELSKRLVQAL